MNFNKDNELDKEELKTIDLELKLEEIDSELESELNSKGIKIEEMIIFIEKQIEKQIEKIIEKEEKIKLEKDVKKKEKLEKELDDIKDENNELREYFEKIYNLLLNKSNILAAIQTNIVKLSRFFIRNKRIKREYEKKYRKKGIEKEETQKISIRLNIIFKFNLNESSNKIKTIKMRTSSSKSSRKNRLKSLLSEFPRTKLSKIIEVSKESSSKGGKNKNVSYLLQRKKYNQI